MCRGEILLSVTPRCKCVTQLGASRFQWMGMKERLKEVSLRLAEVHN